MAFQQHKRDIEESVVNAPKSCLEPDDVPFFLSLYGYGADGVARNIYPAINRAWVPFNQKLHIT